jgi:hypothetical protein
VRVSDDGFIGLPPGMLPPIPDVNSGTVRRERPDRSNSGSGSSEIVFFPAVPGMPVPQAAAPDDDGATRVVERPTTWRLAVPGHGAVEVRGVLFIGRNPTAPAGHAGGELLAVNDESRSLSKTHAMLEVADGALWVHDLGSTNGVWVVREGDDATKVVPGQRAEVPAGSELELGDLVIGVGRG